MKPITLRLRILLALYEQPKTTPELRDELGANPNTLHSCTARLEAAGIISRSETYPIIWTCDKKLTVAEIHRLLKE